VLNLPLRPPAVLAKAAASLDLLSPGRVVMGLGAGAFWDGITAMGGARRTPGEAVEALEEAIRIMRALWDTDHPGAVFQRGKHYVVDGARRGPAPEHDIPIWVGAYKPRMLRLIGRLADGWLPSLGYLRQWRTLVPELTAMIDAAAEEAGRDPATIDRVLNVSGDANPELLAELALQHGFSTFIVPADDPGLIEDFAREVAPATRDLVERARAARASSTDRLDPASAGGEPAGQPEAHTPAQPEAPAEPGDLPPSEAADLLVQIHEHLRTELRQLRNLVSRVAAGRLGVAAARSAINEMTLRQNDWTLGMHCAAYCRVVTMHHSIEDASVFPHLRRADPELGPALDRLAAEHVVVHDLLEDVDRALVAYVDDPEDSSGLDDALELLSSALLAHLDGEERDLLAALARHGFGN
jgi:alkanesulfonate monooxygenase SsuD/methylene tetrahydromethanopterin reductase-like flavin-dependent oxidoreductase (luciferase family)